MVNSCLGGGGRRGSWSLCLEMLCVVDMTGVDLRRSTGQGMLDVMLVAPTTRGAGPICL